ncbi:Glucose/ribitol dehydrogenase family and NAD(P)-binding domain-containing protein [Strongyloides ratti]|uniref:Glucose/ribitol dehydrogenase family and NAD(P)-binding domain-containing protein n=1 Tax=Strongyloides ratti TaxID=34506 RepID=A0A090LJE4_STRRB|nr:Glucose/ribitol dehydrogenase family and NAD(P)-binding domain-containing protein [Strongyloides ratti]CEF67660.1 Glucose/ribitol dehydrogenase family and NAD(P)-binding domain-containing protein [Strongyloides ratti]
MKPLQTLAGQCAVVTNIATPLGYALARRIGMAGAKIFVTGTCNGKTTRAIETLSGIGVDVTGNVIDITKEDERKKLIEVVDNEFGKLDSLVINHQQNTVKGLITDATTKDFNEMCNKYLTSSFDLSNKFYPLLQKSENPSVVLMASITGFTPFLDVGVYSVVNSGILGLTKTLSQMYGQKNCRVNSVSVGMISEDGSGAIWDEPNDELRSQLEQLVPLGRVGKIYECTNTVEFLCGRGAMFTTGENFVINGGLSVRI